MSKILNLSLAAAAIAVATPANAADFLLNFTDAGAKQVEAKTNPDNWYGNTRTFSFQSGGETLNVKVSAWNRVAANGDYDSVKTAYLGWWTGTNAGLGVTNRNEGDGSGNTHTIDNRLGWDFLTLQFDRSVNISNGVFNAYKLDGLNYTDTDAYVAVDNAAGAWNKALNITSWNAFSAGFDKALNTNATGAVASQKIDMTGRTGNMWIIGASIDGPDSLHDAFKLGALSVTAVPEPATWAMMLVGFGMVGAAARYRRRSTGAAIA